MEKNICLLLFFCAAFTIRAQVAFQRQPLVTLPGLTLSTVASDDFNSDGFPDLLMSGVGPGESRNLRLYFGDGMGGFVESSPSIMIPLSEGSISIADVDGDHDPDVLMTGSTNNGFNFAQTNLYLNDGPGTYSLSTTTGLLALDQSASIFADVDGDQDADLLLTGVDTTNSAKAILFLNDGNGQFSPSASQVFKPMRSASIASGDVDGDLDLDIVVSGWCVSFGSFCYSADLYLNDGMGNFTLQSLLPLGRVSLAEVALADLDGDLDLDLVISGIESSPFSEEYVTKVFANDGSGEFEEIPGNDISITGTSGLEVKDLDQDSELDLLIAGGFETTIFLNNGEGVFNAQATPNILQIFGGDVLVDDFDLDGDADLVLTGDVSQFKVGAYYVNNTQTVSLHSAAIPGLKVFPNPANEVVRVESVPGVPVSVKVLDLQGRQHLSMDLPLGLGDVPIPELEGVYILVIERGGGREVRRILSN